MFANFIESSKHNPLRMTGVVFFLFVFAAIFTLRGPFRALTDPGINDLISPYIQASAWLHGADPYSSESLLRFWPRGAEQAQPSPGQMRDGSVLIRHGIPTAYPLNCFTLLAPFTLIPWPIFKIMWVAMSVGLFFASIRSLVSLANLNTPQRVMFSLASLLLAPFHSGIATCNIAIVAAEVGVIAVWFAHERRQVASGILIAICIGLKPQIGLCFLAYYVIRRCWTASAIAFAAVAATTIVAIFRLSLAHVRWLTSYELDNRALLSSGVLGDFTERNHTRFGLVNLQVAIYPWLRDRVITNICVLIFCVALFACALILMRRLQAKDDLLSLSAITTLSLLPVYHRFYDAALLIVPLCWLVANLKSNCALQARFFPSMVYPRGSSAMGLLMISVFFIPGGSLLEVLRDKRAIPMALSGYAWWNSLVMAHAVWCLVGLVFVLLCETARVDAQPISASPPSSPMESVPF
jgi:hypothetical protein